MCCHARRAHFSTKNSQKLEYSSLEMAFNANIFLLTVPVNWHFDSEK
jgi:hypothetical protein